MFDVIKNYSRAKKLLIADDARIEAERIAAEKNHKLKEAISRLGSKNCNYLTKLSKTDPLDERIDLIALYRELNRIELSLYVSEPLLYREVFSISTYKGVLVIFDNLFCDNRFVPYSLTEIDLAKNDEAYINLYKYIESQLTCLRKLASLINSYS